jgi:hypothetical protein
LDLEVLASVEKHGAKLLLARVVNWRVLLVLEADALRAEHPSTTLGTTATAQRWLIFRFTLSSVEWKRA